MQVAPPGGLPRYAGFFIALVCLLILAVSVSLLPTQLSEANFGADGGDLLAAIMTRGVPHPTGYPTYVLLGMLTQRIPIGSPYFRGALLSAVPAALAPALLAAWMGRSRGGWGTVLPALMAAAAWGVSPLLLSQAVIVEVHGLQALFAVLALGWTWLLLQESAVWGRGYTLVALALIYGLGLGDHLALSLFLPAIGASIWSASRRGLPARWALAQIGALLLGTLVYLYLPLSARGYPPVNWGNPQTWGGFLWVVSGGPYRGLMLGGPSEALPERLVAWFSLLRQQYGLLGLALGAAGIVLSSRADRRFARLLGWVFLSFSLLALAYHTADAMVYLIPATMVWAVWIGYALRAAWGKRWRGLPWGWLLCLFFCASILVRFPQVYRQVDPRQETRTAEFARQLLDEAPPGALVLAQSDPDTFSLWYGHFGLGERPDLVVTSTPLTAYGWYQETLIHTYPSLSLPETSEDADSAWVERMVALNPDRPVCRTRLISAQPLSMTFECSPQGP